MRTIWTGAISFGLVNIPVRLYSAVNQQEINFDMLDKKDHSPIRYARINDKTAIITGGDSGIGRAVAIAFAREGANIVISYLNEHTDAEETKSLIEYTGRKCLLIPGDIAKENHCKKIIERTMKNFGAIDILVNNAAIHYSGSEISGISTKELDRTFRTNFYSCFFLSKFAVPNMKKGSSIINTSSVTAYRGSEHLLDYSATKGAIVSFTRSLASNLVKKRDQGEWRSPGSDPYTLDRFKFFPGKS